MLLGLLALHCHTMGCGDGNMATLKRSGLRSTRRIDMGEIGYRACALRIIWGGIFALVIGWGQAQAQISLVSPFLGTWENTNPSARDLKQMEIIDQSGQLKAHLWYGGGSSMADAGTHDIQHYTPIASSGVRYEGSILRLVANINTITHELLVEQGGRDQLKVTLIKLEGADRGKFLWITMRKRVVAEDCVEYNPASLRVSRSVIVSGRSPLISFTDPRDLELGLSLARSYTRLCMIGRDNARADRNKYIFEYWTGGTEGATAPSYDCIDYDPARLRIVNIGAEGYRVESVMAGGSSYLQLFNTLSDANAGLAVFRSHRQQCFIARGSREVRSYLK